MTARTQRIQARIGILAGGSSSERDISLKSGRAVFDALMREGCDTEFIDIKDDPLQQLKDFKIDVAFIALHGKYGEDGTIQRILEALGIPYTGSGVPASRLALDKIASRMIFRKNGIRVPGFMAVNKTTDEKDILNTFRLPLVIKPKLEGSSIGLSIVRDAGEVSEALDRMFRYGDEGIAEEYIEGRELTVGIFNEESLPVIEIVSKNSIYDFTAKYEDKETSYLVPAPVGKKEYGEAQALGLQAHKSLGCRDFSRVDMRMDRDRRIYVLEVNSIPGLTERSLLPKAARARGISFNELCVKLVELALGHDKTAGVNNEKE